VGVARTEKAVRRKRSKWRWRLGVLAVATLIPLAVLEIAARSVLGNLGDLRVIEFWPRDGRLLGLRPGVTTTYNGYFLRVPEVTMKVNEVGFRGRSVPKQRSPGRYRIALFGDSFTYGVGVEEDQTTAVVLESLFRDAGHNVEVLNFGIPGANAPDLLTQYPLFIAAWRPDLLILQVSPNDLDAPMFTRDDAVDPDVVMWIFGHFYTPRILLVAAAIGPSAVLALFSETPPNLGVAGPVSPPAGKGDPERVAAFRSWIDEIGSAPTAAGIAFRIVLLGSPVPGASGEDLVRLARDVETEALDATDLLWGGELTIPNEGHLNALGHRRLAERHFESLKAQVVDALSAPQLPPGAPTR
jgi:lysophospholipase L1-like esterase